MSLWIPTWSQAWHWFLFLVKLDVAFLMLLAVTRGMGWLADRFSPEFGDYVDRSESSLSDARRAEIRMSFENARRQHLHSAMAGRRMH